MDNTISDFNIALIPVFAEVIVSEGISDKVRLLRFSALKTLQSYLNHYETLGYMQKLLYGIAEKKGKMILEISSKTEMDKMLKPHCPHYNGAEFIPDRYSIPEEELICWSQTSLLAPLNSTGQKRYMEIFKSVLPDEYAQLFSQEKHYEQKGEKS